MIAEDLLERGLAADAACYDVPADAVDRLRQRLAPPPPPRRRLRRLSPRGWLAVAAAALVLLVAVPLAVGGGSSTPDYGAASGGAAVPLPAVRAPESAGSGSFAPVGPPAKSSDSGRVSSGPAGSTVPTGVTSRVVKTGELDLRAPAGQVGATLDRLAALAGLLHGFVADSHSTEGGSAPSGEVTLRVPVASFGEAVSRARHLDGVKVLSLQTSGEDVTAKYVDLRARIGALEKTRANFLTLLSHAKTIGQTLAVQQHVTDVQTQIEQLQGQLRVLRDQSAMSTLTVTVDQRTAAPVRHQESGMHRALDRSVHRFLAGVEAIVAALGPILLVLLLAAFGWFLARVGYRRLRRELV